MNLQNILALTAASLLVAVSSTAQAQIISIDFAANGNGGQPVMAPTEVAGVIAVPNWNSLLPNLGAGPNPLMDSTGTGGFGNITFTGNGDYTLGGGGNNAPGNQKMLNGYIDTGDATTSTFTITNLGVLPGTLLTVYVYADGDGQNGRLGTYAIPGVAPLVLNDNTNATSTAGVFDDASGDMFGNYLVFANVPANANGGFTLTATATAGGGTPPRAPVNGLQISLPEPSTALLGGLGLLGILARRRRA